MKLQTQIPLNPSENQLDYNGHLLLLGSCFTQNIGKKLDHFRFQSLQNPFGILFHPKAIENLISKSIDKETYTEKDIFFHNERWHCFDAHSDLSDASKEKLIEKLNKALRNTNQQITKSTQIIITLGTAWMYRKLEEDKVVANCHKILQREFEKELLSVEQVLNCLKTIVEKIVSINKNTEIIFTISPVRHIKDGFVENQRSKAHLIAAIHNLLPFHAESKNISYFPAYELMMDELRDYRFYESDMIHPNQLAIDYIWEKFMEVWISEKSHFIMDKVDQVQKGLQHRPFKPDSEQHLSFVKSLDEKITYLQKEYPFMIFDDN